MNNRVSADFFVRDKGIYFLNPFMIDDVDNALTKVATRRGDLYKFNKRSEDGRIKIPVNYLGSSFRDELLRDADESFYSRCSEGLIDAATGYAIANAHKKYAQSICELIKGGSGPGKDYDIMLDSIDKIISFYSRKESFNNRSLDARRKNNEYRSKIRKMKNSGDLKSGDRWPRKPVKNNHIPLNGLKTAINISLIEAEALFGLDLDYANRLERGVIRGMNLLRQLPNSQREYKDESLSIFESFLTNRLA